MFAAIVNFIRVLTLFFSALLRIIITDETGSVVGNIMLRRSHHTLFLQIAMKVRVTHAISATKLI